VKSSGDEVELLADDDRPGGWLLLLDRVRQSYVDLNDPTYLEFPYVRALAAAIAALPAGPLDIVHIGGGGATLARWVTATRPDSRQLVFEAHADLLQVVRTRLPIDPSSGIELVFGDGRSALADLPDETADVVVVDAFSGGRVPADLTTIDAIADAARILRPKGLLLLNVTAAAESEYLHRLVATLATSFAEFVLHGDRDGQVGNVVIVVAREYALPVEVIVDDGPLGPPLALSGGALSAFIEGIAPLSTGASMRSPQPPDETWRVGTDFDLD
jgi:SAM-dependent methyltransferase